ncbi:MAG: copper chaperone PCu(A)C [Sinobacteraceae bacterium]|nr:copper chaperone PCu(A)C [Nevskiaceae bacterium]
MASPQAALSVRDAWIRATPGADVAAAYMTLQNPSGADITITAIESPVAKVSMIHQTSLQDHQSRMRPLARLSVAAGQTLNFQRAGLHVMLEGLREALSPGQSVPLVLSLADGSSLTVAATVRPPGAE